MSVANTGNIMDVQNTSDLQVSDQLDGQPLNSAIAQLVGEVYEVAPVIERSRLLEHLMRPLGVLSLFGVANGIFAGLRFRGGWQDFHVRLEDAQRVRASDVIALANHAQQVSVEAVDALAQMLRTSPMIASSAAAALLVSLLVHRARKRSAATMGDDDSLVRQA